MGLSEVGMCSSSCRGSYSEYSRTLQSSPGFLRPLTGLVTGSNGALKWTQRARTLWVSSCSTSEFLTTSPNQCPSLSIGSQRVIEVYMCYLYIPNTRNLGLNMIIGYYNSSNICIIWKFLNNKSSSLWNIRRRKEFIFPNIIAFSLILWTAKRMGGGGCTRAFVDWIDYGERYTNRHNVLELHISRQTSSYTMYI